ncbi:MAG: hypothetical protein NBV63_01115 [Candidatus Pacebacteria bacterium]|nr:hypothetical protein [Candidatus Paceibacterota bacterium]
MKSRGEGKNDEHKNEKVPLEELMYRVQAKHLLMQQRALEYARKDLGIEKPKSKNKLIERKSDGTFFYNGKPITNDINTQYMRVFRAIFESDSSKDYIPYSPLNRRIELYGEEKLLDHARVIKRIQNGVKEFFYKTKIPELLTDGRAMIEYKRGKGVIFNNPDIG